MSGGHADRALFIGMVAHGSVQFARPTERVGGFGVGRDRQPVEGRADLIPNLVETVKGYAQQEQTVFIEIAEARSRLAGATTPKSRQRNAG